MNPRRKNRLRGIIFSSVYGPIRIRTNRFGTLRLRELSLNDTEFLENLLKTKLTAREFTVQFIHHQLVKPELGMEAIQDWTDKLLLRVAALWTKHESEVEPLLWRPQTLGLTHLLFIRSRTHLS